MKRSFWTAGVLSVLLITPALAQEETASPASGADGKKAASLPRYFLECENDHCETGGGFARWVFDGKAGIGNWREGEAAKLSVENFDGKNITIRRSDTDDSIYSGMTAVYTGTLSGDRIEGTVTWSWVGHWDDQAVSDSWYAIGRNVPFDDEDSNLPECASVQDHTEAAMAPLAAGRYFWDQGDMPNAFCWIRRAAVEDRDLKGAALLSTMYAAGFGILPDVGEAWSWARTSSQRSYPLPEEVNLALQSAALGISDPEADFEDQLAKDGSPFLRKLIDTQGYAASTSASPVLHALFLHLMKPGDRPYSEGEWVSKCVSVDHYLEIVNECGYH